MVFITRKFYKFLGFSLFAAKVITARRERLATGYNEF